MTADRRPSVGEVTGPLPTSPHRPPRPVGPRRASRFPDAETRRRVLRRRRRLAGALALTVVAVLVLGSLFLAGLGNPPPAATVRLSLPASASVGRAAAPPALPWTPTGQSAVAVPVAGFTAQSGHETPVPVASMTKIMTAYVVLHDHPLRLGQDGPSITVSAADAQDFGADTVTDQANVLLQVGESLTEVQMLEGLLVHSANDVAFALATWDAGSVTAFVAKMNATAARLGMGETHFTDASGFDPTSVSTAADLLTVAGAAMAEPVFAHIVTMQAVTLPLAGTVPTYTPMLGSPGVVGVKSGFTTAAGGGDVLAYDSDVGGHRVLVLAAVTSQEGPTVLTTAGQEALALAQAVAGRVAVTTVATSGRSVGTAAVDGGRAAVVVGRSVTLLAVPGSTVRQAVTVSHPPRGGDPAGTAVGTATFALGTQRVRVPVHTDAPLPGPSLLQRLG